MNAARERRTRAAAAAILAAALLTGARAQQPAPATSADGALPIDLATALRLADERNLDVAIYIARVAEASARLTQARALAIPTVRVGGSYHSHDGSLQEVGGDIVDADRTARFRGFGAGAVGAGDVPTPGVALGVDLADAIFAPLVARQNRAALDAAALANRHRVLADVAVAYLRLLAARGESRIVLDASQRAADLAALTEDYANAGEGLRADAEMAAVQPLIWAQRRLAAEEHAETAAAEVGQLLHLDSSVRLEPLEEDIPSIEIFGVDADVAQLIAHALESRPEADQFDALVGAAESDLAAQRYGWFIPSVALNYSSGELGGGPGSTIAATSHRDDLTLQLYWQFDAFGIGNRARVEEKRARLERAALERDKLRDAIAAEVREDFARVRSLSGQLAPAAAAVERARAAYDLQRERIYDQQGLPLEGLQAMQALATAELALLDVRAGYSLAQLRLHTALGNPVDAAQR